MDRRQAIRAHPGRNGPRGEPRARIGVGHRLRWRRLSMATVITFGEVMLRLKSPGFERLFQSPMLEATFGGAEVNASVPLGQYGIPVGFASAVPANNIADACVGGLRRFGLDASAGRRQGER